MAAYRRWATSACGVALIGVWGMTGLFLIEAVAAGLTASLTTLLYGRYGELLAQAAGG